MALTGTLADVRLDELATLLQQQQRTGRLVLDLQAGRITIDFRNGQICQVDDEGRPASRRIGELLVEAGRIDRNQLAAAVEAQTETGKPLGTLLVSAGALNNQTLHHFLGLQFRETLYPLFEVTTGDFEFDASGFPPRTCAPPPMPVEEVLMDAARRIDELPGIEEWIPGLQARVFRLTDDPEAATETGPELGTRERAVFHAIDGRPTVDSLVPATGLDSFEVMKALSQLVQIGLIDVEGRRAASGGFAPVGSELGFWLRRAGVARPLLQLVLTLGVALTLGILLLNVYVERIWSPANADVHRFAQQHSPLRDMQTQTQVGRLQGSIEAFRLDHGRYPPSLDVLVERQLLAPADLTYPSYREPYHYRPTGDGYVLLPPKR